MEDRTCALCGAPFSTTKPNKKFCSSACAVTFNRADIKTKRQAAAAPIVPIVCPGCEEPFMPETRKQRWCSLRCGARIRARGYRDLNAPPSIKRPCRYCGAEFSSVDGRQYYCSDECTKTAKSLREAERRYGITMQEYRAVWLRQQGVCAICNQSEMGERNTLLAVDHDHVTGHFRGLLCSHCNRAIGLLKDDPKVIEAAARYVRDNRQPKLVIV